MSKFFYTKIAITNIKKNKKTYFPYIITCLCTISMFYIMCSLANSKDIMKLPGSANLLQILFLGTVITGIFSSIFLFYTNSFLMKNRKKEFGLYNILGLEKRHIAKIIFIETCIIGILTLIVGLIVGIILDKLMFLILAKIISVDVKLSFYISLKAIVATSILFAGIFFAILISSIIQIKILKPIELLKGGRIGEREPKTRIIMAIIGVLALGAGYFIAVTTENSLIAFNLFFIAVILVMIGIYNIFTAGSIFVLKLLKKNKKFYYKAENFISVSGMIYRMKQNAVGLANICILSTAVILIMSTTTSLYGGIQDALVTRYRSEISVSTNTQDRQTIDKINEIVDKAITKDNISIEKKAEVKQGAIHCNNKDGKYNLESGNYYDPNLTFIGAVSLKSYNEATKQNINLKQNEVLMFSVVGDYGKGEIEIGNKKFKIKEELNKFPFEKKKSADIIKTYILVMDNINEIIPQKNIGYTIEIDTKENEDKQKQLAKEINKSLKENKINAEVEGRAANKQEILSMYGGLLFIGIFLGGLFLMATVLIIYYKQISEGYNDRENFKIMQKVGMDKKQIKKTIRKQVLIVFFIPLGFAVINIIFAFPMITKILVMLNLDNILLFKIATIVTIIAFSIIYGIVFTITAKTYYKIIE